MPNIINPRSVRIMNSINYISSSRNVGYYNNVKTYVKQNCLDLN